MSASTTGVKAHDDTANKSESVRQASTAGVSQATIVSAEVTHYRAVVKSALANNVSPSVAMQALKELGVTGQ